MTDVYDLTTIDTRLILRKDSKR